MEKCSIDDLENEPLGSASIRRRISNALGKSSLAINWYRIAPGEGLPGGLHAHADQEEVFVVRAGEATFETLAGQERLSDGEAIVFEPGEFQSGRNDGESELVVLAVGAPRESTAVRIPVDCLSCDSDRLELDFSGELTFVCPGCETEQRPRDCPDCGFPELQIRMVESSKSTVCQDCGAVFDRPPLE